MYKHFVKRLLDIILSLCAIVVLSPLLLFLTVLGTFKMKGNPFFTQERPGWHEKVFKLIKFRTMTNEKDKHGELLPDEIRLNGYGEFLRSTSLDELPELFNILIGDMSIIGPRPLIPEYIPYYSDVEKKRHNVRPGLSGLAQVNGRSFISWEEIFAYDIEYVSNITFVGDCRIVFRTVKKVFQRENIADLSEATIDKDGKYHFQIDGKDFILHQPLHVERGNINAERNRQ